MSVNSVTLADARANLSRITQRVNETGEPVTVFRRSKPWVVISPAAGYGQPNAETRAAMRDADDLLSDPGRTHFATYQDMMAAIDGEDDDA